VSGTGLGSSTAIAPFLPLALEQPHAPVCSPPAGILPPPVSSSTISCSGNTSDASRAAGEIFGGGVLISVAGHSFHLPSSSSSAFSISLSHISAYQQILRRKTPQPSSTFLDLEAHFRSLRAYFAPDRAESDALLDANGFNWPPVVLDRDIHLLRSLGSLDAVIQHHSDQHKSTGFNSHRVNEFLRADPHFDILKEIAEVGGEIDFDDDFTPFRRSAPLRNLQQRMLPVYRKHAYKMWQTNRGLLFRLKDLDPGTLASLHTGNDCHWTPKPGNPLGRFLFDGSNSPPGTIPLNGGSAKEKGIARYQKVVLPTLFEVIRGWDEYRRHHGLNWWQMIMFKEDVSGAFNQLNWSVRSAKYLGVMIDEEVIFIMITGGFGHCVTPMIWSIVGEAINRRARQFVDCPIYIFVDDTVGAGLPSHALHAQAVVQRSTEEVLGVGSTAPDKSSHGPREVIFGFLVDFITATLSPKDLAIDKIFFVFFHIDTSSPQPLEVWQCLASIAQFYAQGVRGMSAFVAPLHHMTRKCSGRLKRSKASASAMFAVEMWRVMAILLLVDRVSVSVPLDSFLLSRDSPCNFEIISDASPWRLASAIYHPLTHKVLAWSTLLLPFARGAEGKFQVQREYLGHLFSLLLIFAYSQQLQPPHTSLTYRWVNDNTGALSWAAKHKCSSPSSFFAGVAVSQLHLLTRIEIMEATYLPGKRMGEIDAMSRREIHPDISVVCPSLVSELLIDLELPPIRALFAECDPAKVFPAARDVHTTFLHVHDLLSAIFLLF